MFRTLWEDDERYVSNYFSKYGPETYFTGDGAKAGLRRLLLADGPDRRRHQRRRPPALDDRDRVDLVEHQAVAEAATCGASDPDRGQCIVCFVLLKSGYEPSDELAEELRQFVAAKIGKIAGPLPCSSARISRRRARARSCAAS
jgi:acetyl-CoA synthetase